ncbi:MAG: AraC family transcriptional regulator [Pseudomonadota bacterium]
MAQEHYTIGCIERAVQHMAAALNDNRIPQLEDIAQASNLSKFHFHRMYKLVMGETCHQTVTRLRLARGIADLSAPDASITDAAITAGFSSSQAFAKAMKNVTSETASTLKREPGRLTDMIQILGQAPGRDGKAPLIIELAAIKPFEILVTRTEGIYPELNDTYGRLFGIAGGPQNVEAILGMPHGNVSGPQTEALLFDCGLKLKQNAPEVPPGYEYKRIETGVYILARSLGSYDHLADIVDMLYRYALATPDARISDMPLLFHYLDDPEETMEKALRTDIYLKLETLSKERE